MRLGNRIIWLSLGAAAATAAAAYALHRKDGCLAYISTDQPLVAHAGGGLPTRLYANDFEAMDRAVRNGHSRIELDFWEENGTLKLGHDAPGAISLAELLDWLEGNDVAIVTDLKTDPLRGLDLLAQQAGDLQPRFIPQIYERGQFEPVRRMGFRAPIFASGRGAKPGWRKWVNEVDLEAVAIPHFPR